MFAREDKPRWWEVELPSDESESSSPFDPAQLLFEETRWIENEQSDDRERMLKFMRLYDPYAYIASAEIDLRSYMGEGSTGMPSMNICKSVVDTLASMIAKNRPRATFMTDGADWSTERQAKLLEKFIEGEFQRLDVYNLAPRCFKDSSICGLGFLIGELEDGKVCLDRGLWDEAVVDEVDGRYGMPLVFRRRRFIQRSELISAFPDFEDQIKSAQSSEEDLLWTKHRQLDKDEIVFLQAWKRATPNSPGRYIEAISNCTLEFKEYDKDHFPIVFMKYDEKVSGFWGTGIIQELAGVQNRLNRINWVITRVQDLHGVHRVVMHISDSNNEAKFDNRPDRIWFYREKPPQFLAPQAVPVELYQERDRLIARAYQLAGVSEMSAQSKKPADLESAVALREFNDIESMRFSIQAQRYEQFHLDIARLLIELHSDLQAQGGKSTTTWQTKNLTRLIDFADVEMDQALYAITVQPASALPRTPAGRIQTAIELSQAGLITPDEARRIMDHPDLQSVLDLENSAIEDAQWVIEQLSNGEYEPPEPAQNLDLLMQLVTQASGMVRRKKAPEEIQDLFRRWLAQAAMIKSPPQVQPPGGAPMPPPGGVPQAPPQGIQIPPPNQQMQLPAGLPPG